MQFPKAYTDIVRIWTGITSRVQHFMMKQNISPPIGYANGSQGKMIGIVPKEGNVLPPGAPGEMIKIEPPEYVIMENSHKKGEQKWTTIVPCKRKKVKLDYIFSCGILWFTNIKHLTSLKPSLKFV